jgi:hypothetical protein
MAAGSLARWLLDSLSSRHATDVEDDGLAGASVLVLHASVRPRPGAAWEVHTKVVPTDSVASPVLKDAVLFTLLGYVALVILPRRLWRLLSSWRWPVGQADKAD